MRFLKLIFTIVLIILVLLFLKNSVAPFLDHKIYLLFNKQEKITTPKTRKECIKNNGEWRRPGLWPKETCMLKTKDGNKFCLSGFKCETGHCLHYIDLRNQPVFASGRCPSYQIFFGCFQEVHFGFTRQAICID